MKIIWADAILHEDQPAGLGFPDFPFGVDIDAAAPLISAVASTSNFDTISNIFDRRRSDKPPSPPRP